MSDYREPAAQESRVKQMTVDSDKHDGSKRGTPDVFDLFTALEGSGCAEQLDALQWCLVDTDRCVSLGSCS